MAKDMDKENILFDESSQTIEELKEELKRPKRQYKRRKKEEIEEEISQKLSQFFTPENFEALVKLPSEMLFALTGWEGWLLSQGEKQALSVSASTCATYWLRVDPKWVALALFMINFSVIYGGRALAYNKLVKEKVKEGKEVKVKDTSMN